MAFTHLHVHTEYSPLDGISRLEELVARAAADGQTALAITDHGNLSGAWAFQNACEAAGVKPVIGCEVYLAVGSRYDHATITIPDDDAADPEAADREKRYHHLTLIARSRRGWRNLNLMLADAEHHVWSKPRIDYDLLAEHADGIIVLTGCLGGPVLGSMAQAVAAGQRAAQARATFTGTPADLLEQATAHARRWETIRGTWERTAATLTAAARRRLPTPEHATLDTDLPEPFTATMADITAWRTERDAIDTAAGRPIVAAAHAADRAGRDADRWQANAREALDRIIAAVGHENVYVEVMEHGIPAETAALPAMAALADEYGLPLVATNDAHYTSPEDQPTHEAILAMQSKRPLDDPRRFRFHGHGYHLRTEAEMRALRDEPWWQTACDNTALVPARVADRVMPSRRMRLPHYPVPDGHGSEMDHLRELVWAGARQRYGAPVPDGVVERLEHELGVIEQMGFPAYFLIVREMIHWSRAHGIIVGPGRGSAAGSCVSYCLGIVTIDPLRHGLLFERFLEPGRKGMPDIDTDFEKARFDLVYDWAQRRYGAESVARIGTFAIATTKRAIKDAARVLRMPGLGDRLSKAVPVVGGKPYTFDQLARKDDLKGEKFRRILAASRGDGARVVDLAARYANTIAGTSVHACGVIISAKPLVGHVPVRLDGKELAAGRQVYVTEWTGPELEDLGLLKMDMLRIRNLDVIAKAIDYIEATTGERIDYYGLPDPDTHGDDRVNRAWRLLREGRTSGVFQMDSDGMRRLAQQIQPTRWSDLTAILALYRPGPMGAGMHETYARRKSGDEPVDYTYLTDDPVEARWIDTVLGDTFGVFVYQEQVMRLGTVIAGFNAAMRSKLRKAIGKKKKNLLDEVFTAMRDGGGREFRAPDGQVISPVFRPETVERVIDAMQDAASYLFNKSHAAAYAQVTFNTAYLKANWPAAYGAAILATTGDDSKRATAIRSLQEEGVRILPPDVNRSRVETFPEDETSIRLGLGEVKGVGEVAEAIVAARPDGGYLNGDHLRRIIADRFNVSAWEALIGAGACDDFGPRLGQLQVARTLTAPEPVPVPNVEYGLLERSVRERALLGVSLSENPLRRYRDQIRAWRVPGVEAEGGEQLGAHPVTVARVPKADGALVIVAGILATAKERAYSKGQMLDVTIEGGKGALRGVMWAEDLAAQNAAGGVPQVGSVVAARARVRIREFEIADETGEAVGVERVRELTVTRLWRIPIDECLQEPRLDAGQAAVAFALMADRGVSRWSDLGDVSGFIDKRQLPLVSMFRRRPTVTATVCPVCGRHRYVFGAAPARCTMTWGCPGRPVRVPTNRRLSSLVRSGSDEAVGPGGGLVSTGPR